MSTEQAKVLEELKAVFNKALQDNDLEGLLKISYPLEELALERRDYRLIGAVYALVTSFFLKFGKTELLIRHCVKYLDMAEAIPELKEFEDYYSMAAMLDYTLEDHEQAMIHVQQEMEVHRKAGNIRAIGSRMSNVAELQFKKGDYSNALETALDGKLLLQELGEDNSFHGIASKSVILKCYLALEDYERAKTYMDQILAWPELDSHMNLRVELYEAYGKYYHALGDQEKALMYYEEAIETAEEFGFNNEQKDLFKAVSDIYEAYGDYKNSQGYLKRYVKQLDKDRLWHQSILKVNAEIELELLHTEKRVHHLQQLIGPSEASDAIDEETGLYEYDYLEAFVGRRLRQNKVSGKVLSVGIIKVDGLTRSHGTHWLTKLSTEILKIKKENHIMGWDGDHRLVICMVEEPIDQAQLSVRKYMEAMENLEPGFKVFGGIVDDRKAQVEDVRTFLRLADLSVYQSEKSGNTLTTW